VPAPYDIATGRLIFGAMMGAVAALAYFGIQFGQAWPLAVIFGGPPAAVGVVLLVPIYYALRRWQLLNIYMATVVGGILTLMPYVLLTAYDYRSPPIKYGSALSILVEQLLWYFAAGAIGGTAGWVTAVGFQTHPLRRHG